LEHQSLVELQAQQVLLAQLLDQPVLQVQLALRQLSLALLARKAQLEVLAQLDSQLLLKVHTQTTLHLLQERAHHLEVLVMAG
jgi:hypothetical protein